MQLNTKYCSDMNESQEFDCTCNDGFRGKRCEIDLCDGAICQFGNCDAGNCTCNNGYINIENSCVETCDLNPCEVFT